MIKPNPLCFVIPALLIALLMSNPSGAQVPGYPGQATATHEIPTPDPFFPFQRYLPLVTQ